MKFKEQLGKLGICAGDVVLIHSSMKALKTKLTPLDFLAELMELITSEGTILLPALTYESVTFEKPYFSVLESEPCVGILPKTFMKISGVVRSIHPTHSVFAWGAKADIMTREHFNDNTPVGPNSPFMLLPEFDGKILFIGDILYSCTFMHGIEEIANVPYVFNDEMTRYLIKDSKGNTFDKEYYTHNFMGWEQEYPRIRDILDYPDIRTGNIYSAPCTLIDSAKLKAAATERLKDDEYAFVSPV